MFSRPVFCSIVAFILGLSLTTAPSASEQVAKSPDAVHPLLIGSQVPPQLTLRTPAGDAFELNAAIAERPTVLIFYRGGW